MKLPKRPANKAEKLSEVIADNLKKGGKSKPKEGVNLGKLAKKMAQRKEAIDKDQNEYESKDENEQE